MFTGIIEEIGIVSAIQKEEGNIHFTIESQLSAALKIDQSVAHNGCCLTVVELTEGKHTVTAIHETLAKTNLSDLEFVLLMGQPLGSRWTHCELWVISNLPCL